MSKNRRASQRRAQREQRNRVVAEVLSDWEIGVYLDWLSSDPFAVICARRGVPREVWLRDLTAMKEKLYCGGDATDGLGAGSAA